MRNGTELAQAFHDQVVAPIIERYAYAAGRLGSGSDVLGTDDDRSRDHDWGCRLTILVDEPDAVAEIRALLDERLPDEFDGHPVRFPVTWDQSESHRVSVDTVDDFARDRLTLDPRTPWGPIDWLMLTGQAVLEVTAGTVFVDATQGLAPLRERLAWYPAEVECYVVASAWARIGGRLPMLGRSATTGQETQSRLISARIGGDLMRLAYLLHRKWPPYAKWREKLLPVELDLSGVFADDWRDREAAICAVADRLNGAPATEPFFDRPVRTIRADLVQRHRAGIRDPRLRSLPVDLGPIDQWADSDNVLSQPENRAALRAAYASWGSPTADR
ncbi:DUF4037 domain-containing protein [Hamadaea tsunoensis]|uniref:DUF4037 domain-containing protein n=1 Tax=Hamadaea tsunoensis TaxID=53368 RepID=UPI0004221CE7|nr:DUF4037 domain-containing protein [Hamadaea tsunoensis]